MRSVPKGRDQVDREQPPARIDRLHASPEKSAMNSIAASSIVTAFG
ncbi:MAG TPA: hypothetical protein VE871_11315 [Longimicrobium sp.]|nr:hypothetical protein [Longimicrobium sp.]